MAKSPFEADPAFTKLGEETRKAVVQAFDAMSNWRAEIAELSEKNSNAVFDKMSEAAKSLGWPTDFVELCRKQMQNAAKLQLQAVDQVMDLWEKQVKAIGTPSPSQGMPGFPGLSGTAFPQFSGTGLFPSMAEIGEGAAGPIQFWMQAAEMWQKGWQEAISTWVEAQKSALNTSESSGRKSGPR